MAALEQGLQCDYVGVCQGCHETQPLMAGNAKDARQELVAWGWKRSAVDGWKCDLCVADDKAKRGAKE